MKIGVKVQFKYMIIKLHMLKKTNFTKKIAFETNKYKLKKNLFTKKNAYTFELGLGICVCKF